MKNHITQLKPNIVCTLLASHYCFVTGQSIHRVTSKILWEICT